MPRILVQDARDLGRTERPQLGGGPRAAAPARVLGQSARHRDGGRLAGGRAKGREPARSEVDRVEHEDVAGYLLGGRLEEVQIGIQAAHAVAVGRRGGVDPHPARGPGDHGAVAPDVLAQPARRRVGSHRHSVRSGCAITVPPMTARRRRSLALVLLVFAAAATAACGGEERAGAPPTVVVALDFIPNAVHSPIYTAVRTGRDRRARRAPADPHAGPRTGLPEAGRQRARRHRRARHPRPGDRPPARDRPGRDRGTGRPPARRADRSARHQPAARPRGTHGRSVRAAVRPRLPARHPRARRRRLPSRAAGNDRLQRRQPAAHRQGRRRARLLERRGRRAQATRAGRTGVPGRRLRRAALPGGHPHHLAAHARTAARHAPRRAAGDRRRPPRHPRDPDAAVRQIAQAADTRDIELIAAQLRAVAPAFAPALRPTARARAVGRVRRPDRHRRPPPRRRRAFDLTLQDPH